MLFCDYCLRSTEGREHDGALCCDFCEKLLLDPKGSLLDIGQPAIIADLRLSLATARAYMRELSLKLGVDDNKLVDQALGFYRVAECRDFNRGRNPQHVQAVCLYLAFWAQQKPYLLIDFSNSSGTHVCVLGIVFLELCELLSTERFPIIGDLADPSLFIYKFTNNLLKQRNVSISATALKIIESMKRDWMQANTKPAGLCGAALYISAHVHGFTRSMPEIIDRLNAMAKTPIERPNIGPNKCTSKDLLCEHKGHGTYFALGLCETCYMNFNTLSGGLDGGLDPHALQLAEGDKMGLMN